MASAKALESVFELNRRIATALGHDPEAFCCVRRGGAHTVEQHYGIPEYGLEPSAMLSLIKEMRERGFNVSIQVHGADAEWMAGFAKGVELDDKGPFVIEYASHRELPQAVAEAAYAALKAVEEAS